jgi:phospholipase C
MISGSVDGAGGDGEVNLNRSHLGDLLEAKHFGWKAYAEGYPGFCFLGMKKGAYVRRHVPFLSFTNVQTSKERCARIVNADQFFVDYRAGALPEYSLFVPDLKHDGHDTGVEYAGKWFASTFGPILSDSRLMKDTLFIVTFDESESYFGPNRIYTAMIGANVRSGIKVEQKFGHYSILAMIEDLFHLGSLNRMDRTAPKVPDLWQ